MEATIYRLLNRREFWEAEKLLAKHQVRLPWQVSCEYYQKAGEIYWFNSWVRIGNFESLEISDQLRYYPNIKPGDIKYLVWSGEDFEILTRLLSYGDDLHLCFTLVDGFYIPIHIGPNIGKVDNCYCSKPEIEIGSTQASEISPNRQWVSTIRCGSITCQGYCNR